MPLVGQWYAFILGAKACTISVMIHVSWSLEAVMLVCESNVFCKSCCHGWGLGGERINWEELTFMKMKGRKNSRMVWRQMSLANAKLEPQQIQVGDLIVQLHVELHAYLPSVSVAFIPKSTVVSSGVWVGNLLEVFVNWEQDRGLQLFQYPSLQL